jgi:hypothetical protein
MNWLLPLGLALLCLAGLQTFLALLILRRTRSETRALRRALMALAIHLVGEPLRRDPDFVGVLDRYRKTPKKLSQQDRVRARSWIRSAARIYGLTLEEPGAGAAADWGAPPMGENRFDSESPDRPSIEELVDLDPEFLSFIDALRRT